MAAAVIAIADEYTNSPESAALSAPAARHFEMPGNNILKFSKPICITQPLKQV
jgi:hypothetical protein